MLNEWSVFPLFKRNNIALGAQRILIIGNGRYV